MSSEAWPDERIAERIDPTTGLRQRVEFFGSQPEKMLGFTHLPAAAPTAGLVICSPLLAEAAVNRGRERRLADRLATSGIVTLRFDYRGEGRSQGDARDVTFGHLREDVTEAVRRLEETADLSQVAVLGTRLGALVAASATKGTDTPLALWEPVANSEAYFHEVGRSKVIEEMGFEPNAYAEGRSLLDQVAEDVFVDDLTRTNSVDVLGYSISRELHDSIVASSLDAELGTRPRPVLLLWTSPPQRADSDYQSFGAHLKTQGFDVEIANVMGNIGWWSDRTGREQGGVQSSQSRDESFVTTTCSWLVQQLTSSGAA